MRQDPERIQVKVGATVRAAGGTLFVSVPSLKIAEYGNPETRVDVIVGAIGLENEERTLRVGQRIEYHAGENGVYEVRLLSAQNPIEMLVSYLGVREKEPLASSERSKEDESSEESSEGGES